MHGDLMRLCPACGLVLIDPDEELCVDCMAEVQEVEDLQRQEDESYYLRAMNLRSREEW